MSLKRSPELRAGRAQILSQHEGLRREMKTGVVLAGAAIRGNRPCLNELPNLVEGLIARFTEHLGFEERTLLPILRAGDAVDQEYADRMLREHSQHRKELQALLELARSDSHTHALALAFQNLINALNVDMAAEEHWLSEATERAA
jgi:iron-sulfur cluster repair protein YtfE (RIC family)